MGKHIQGEELLALADFDGDDRVDMLWQRSNGATYIQDSETQGGKPSIWMGNYSGQEPLMQSINGLYDSLGFDVGLFSEGAPTSNAAPVFTSGTTANFSENGTGTVYTAISTDEDGDTVYYSLVGGADQTLFNLDSSSGELTFKTSPDYESPADSGGDNVYNVQIDASDGNGGTASQNVAITVANVNDVPSFTSGTTANFSENGTGTVYTAISTDEDGDTVYYSLVGGADQTLFNLDSSSGELTFKTSPDYESPADSGGDNVYNVQIDASDGNGGTASQNVAITVADSLVSAVKVYPGYTTATQQNLGDGIFGKDGLSSGWDYNGDGVLDLLIGVPWHDLTSKEKAGHAWLISGASITSNDADEVYAANLADMGLGTDYKKIVGANSWDQLGSETTFIADISGDGLPEIAVGVPYEKIGGAGTDHVGGSTYIYFSDVLNGLSTSWSTSGWSNDQASVKISGISELDNSGHQVKGSLNIDGDLVEDVVITAPRGNSETGQVFVLFGSAINEERGSGLALDLNSLGNNQGITINGEEVGSYLGWSIETNGDFDGDGIKDLAIGAPQAAGDDGKVYVIFGSYLATVTGSLDLGTLTAAQGLTLTGSIADGEAGRSLASLQDIDGDDKDELVIGAPYAEGSGAALNEGHTYVVFGSTLGAKTNTDMNLSALDGSNGVYLEGRDSSDLSGWSVSNVNDLNGDGLDDLAIGAPDAAGQNGETYIVWSSSFTDESFLSGTKVDLADSLFSGGGGTYLVGPNSVGQFGYQIIPAGDFDGDGNSEFYVSSPGEAYTEDTGAGYLLSESILANAVSGFLAVDDIAF